MNAVISVEKIMQFASFHISRNQKLTNFRRHNGSWFNYMKLGQLSIVPRHIYRCQSNWNFKRKKKTKTIYWSASPQLIRKMQLNSILQTEKREKNRGKLRMSRVCPIELLWKLFNNERRTSIHNFNYSHSAQSMWNVWTRRSIPSVEKWTRFLWKAQTHRSDDACNQQLTHTYTSHPTKVSMQFDYRASSTKFSPPPPTICRSHTFQVMPSRTEPFII